jgi:hypothetical protein
MATQRAHRAFLAHRKAKATGLILPAPAADAAECTNELAAAVPTTAGAAPPEPAPRICTNEFPSASPRTQIDPLAALRTRIRRLLDGAGPPYHGPIDLALLDSALESLRFDTAALTWLAGLGLPPTPDLRAA